ncbi:SAM-dependent methyltransferase [Salinispora pacifica]|nr:class I SAM-dependent methyltransferase [Salinispora pacifica]
MKYMKGDVGMADQEVIEPALSQAEQVVVEDPVVQDVWAGVERGGAGELAESYVLATVLLGVAKAGIASRLSATEWTELVRLMPDGGSVELVRNTLRHLAVRGIVEARDVEWAGAEVSSRTPAGGSWRLTARGADLFDEVSMGLLGFYAEAYAPVLGRLDGLLTGQLDYGTDVTRDAEALGRRCEPMTVSFCAGLLSRLMAERGATSVLELGCGTGGLLLHMAARDASLRAVGLDIAPEAVELARRRVAERGLGDRLEFVVGDAFAPDTWPENAASCDFMLAVGALHEQFRDGEDAVVALLARYRGWLSAKLGRVFLLAEPELRIDAEDGDYFLLHALTKQGFPQPREPWLDVLARAGLTCRRIYTQPRVAFRFAFYEVTAGPAR